MKFTVERTSIWGDKDPNIDGAYRESYVTTDWWDVDDPDKLPTKYLRESWFQNGQNHRLECGRIGRDYVQEAWYVEIATLDDLVRFVEDNGRVVISDYGVADSDCAIEVYDSYRE